MFTQTPFLMVMDTTKPIPADIVQHGIKVVKRYNNMYKDKFCSLIVKDNKLFFHRATRLSLIDDVYNYKDVVTHEKYERGNDPEARLKWYDF